MRNLIIVSDEKRREFADYLSQLISLEDDTEETTVGIKDGTVAAQVWLEKDYKANKAQISSNQHVLFIGHSKFIKEQCSRMKREFSKYGIEYGWLGRQGFISVEKVVTIKEYQDFISFAKGYEENIKQLVSKSGKKEQAGVILAGIGVWFVPLILSPLAVIPFAQRITLNNKIKKQMYSCATMKFYLEEMNEFLGLK